MVKIPNFDSFRGYIPTFLPQISRLSGQCVALAGRKTQFWTTE